MTDGIHQLQVKAPGHTFLAGGGAMGEQMREHDWSNSPVGSPHGWPQSLRTVISLMLNSRFPMFIAWGKALTFFYNDAYSPILGGKHPAALGEPFQRVWSDIWVDLVPLIDQALAGDANYLENLHLVMERHGYREDTWYTFSYSPIRDETGEVGGMFCACTETTKQVLLERQLSNQAERQARVFEQAPGFIAILTGPDHVFEFANAAYAKVSGRQGFVGKSVREVFPDLADQGLFERLDHVYATGERFIAEHIPLRLQRSSGGDPEELFLDFIYAPITDESGAITGIFVEGHDVTQAHRAAEVQTRHERHLRLLVDELNHRVKNTLAIVQGLAQQTFKGSAATSVARDAFEGRLVALASAHNLLTRESWEAAGLNDIVVAAFHAHAVPFRRFTVDGPALRLEPKTAVTLAMALHELTTNARKYGSLSGDDGAVSVTWDLTDDRHLNLRWAEHGGPTVVEPNGRGFGSRMIERALATELRGSVRLSFPSTGVICEIDAQLPDPNPDPEAAA